MASLREQASQSVAPAWVNVLHWSLCDHPAQTPSPALTDPAGGAAAAPRRLPTPSKPQPPRFHLPEEEIAYGPACWLWDYLR